MQVVTERVPNALLKAVSESGKTPKELILAAIEAAPSITYAAAALGVSEATLFRWRKTYGLLPEQTADGKTSC